MTIGQIQEETTHRRVVNALKMHPLIKSIAGDDLLGATSQSGVWVFGNVEATNLDGKVALKVVVPQSEQEIAKREDEVKKIKEKIKMDFGSGYPADPKTKEFIEKNFDNPLYKEIIRFSWSTWKKLNNSTNQKSLKEF